MKSQSSPSAAAIARRLVSISRVFPEFSAVHFHPQFIPESQDVQNSFVDECFFLLGVRVFGEFFEHADIFVEFVKPFFE